MDAIVGFINGLISAPLYCVFYIVVGFLAGALARRIMGSPDASFISDIILGLVGAFIGAVVLRLFNQGPLEIGLGIGSIITALIGAIILIVIGRTLRPQRGKRR